MNFDFITDNMAVGTTPETRADVQALLDAQVTHVLNCRDDVDDLPLLKDTNLSYLWNGTPDWTPEAALGLEPKPVEWCYNSLQFWGLPASVSKDGKLYVHCSAGVNRSATTAWMFLRALQIKAKDCSYIVDTNRPWAAIGLVLDRTWRADAEKALRELGYIASATESGDR